MLKINDNFHKYNGFNILILTPVAASVGLNITEDNHVLHYSRHWNVAKENQATDRIYRIGQKKNVHVYYPMCVSTEIDTFDILLSKLLDSKKKLFGASLFPSDISEVRPDGRSGLKE